MSILPTVRRVEDLTVELDVSAPVVTLFSGGLDSSHLLFMLAERGFRDITALVVELGDFVDTENAAALCEQFGARLEVIDRRAELVSEFVFPAIQAQAIYLGLHPISSSLTRPLIAREGVRLARQVGAEAILHTASRSQNTLRRINGAIGTLGFMGKFGSPYDASAVQRAQKQFDLKSAGIDLFSDRALSSDCNLWCREFESGFLDDPEGFAAPAEFYKWSRADPAAGDQIISLSFREGIPVALDGEAVGGIELIDRLNRIAGAFGLGRYSGLEHLDSGAKVLEVREMPAAEVLLRAYRHLESATVEAETIREKMALEQIWVREALEGRWFGSLRHAAQAFISYVRIAVTGTVMFELSGHGAEVVSIRAERPLYVRSRETWEATSVSAW
ncbi:MULTISPECIES: argininosuccinate synthase-related protein [unclassified Amycolatopsis]|uniref:argininosuccinate synthase-related protein n=1 Tax=unclassified Amycolatopsis TaxID=2618356 RepID=UPI002876433E|nr:MULTISPECIES: argininosuccinate synthase-related protein [unclassified Amycolatopsis]MDS0139274.1 argininosuccinate synthase [Amycolatopsis sp. 505]MDS0144506.1 argininosuccinate synthase [Amycolatopsis sp. CM201R]